MATRAIPATRPGPKPRDGAAAGGFRPAFPLMVAKLRPPVLGPAMVSRARLLALLRADPATPVISVVAPAGYGKTVLLADWAERDGRAVAWLTLDEFDNTPSVFLTYLAAAIDRVHPIEDAIGSALAAPDTRVLAAAVPRLASELHRWGRPGILVIDDVHRLVDQRCLDALGALMDHLPPGFQLVLAGRTEPDLPLARLRANRRLLEIGREDLAFDGPEAAALAAGVGQQLSRDDAERLADRTEGWAAAIYLATLGARRAPAGHVGIAEVSGRDGYIAEYLRSVLGPVLDDHDVALLTRTSILDIVEPGLDEHVSGDPEAFDRLRRLAHANQLIAELAGDEGSFRYHHLLRDHLAAELDRREPGGRARLHALAAEWYAAAGRTELAIEHGIASGDTDAAAELVEATTLRTGLLGHGDRLFRWFDSFDIGVYERRPTLAFGAAIMHALNGRVAAAERMAEVVERSTGGAPPANGIASMESARAVLRALFVRDGPEQALANAFAAAAAEGPGSQWRTLVLEVLAVGHLMRGDEIAADAALAEAVAATPTTGSYAFYALAIRAVLAIARGDWRAAEQHAHEARVRLGRMETEFASAMVVHAVAARVALHRGDVQHGREELVRAQLLRPLMSHVLPGVALIALMETARAYLASSDPAGAANALAEAERIQRVRPQLGALGQQLADLRRRVHDSSRSSEGPSTLTPAELRLLPLLSTHLQFQEIADRLYVSRHTVKAQVVSIYGKLGASSRSEAVARAIEVGLLEPFPGLPLAGLRRDD